jgi:hypothetical protein
VFRGGALGGAALVGGLTLAGPGVAAASVVRTASTGGAAFGSSIAIQDLTLGAYEFDPAATQNVQVQAVGSPVRRRTVGAASLYARPVLPAGTQIASIDVFGFTDANVSQAWELNRYNVDGTADTIGTATLTGAGVLTGSIAVSGAVALPYVIAPGEWLAVGCANTGPTSGVCGAVVRYFVEVPPTFVPIAPRRVYDSRRADTKLAAGVERTVRVADAADGSGEVVPAGARAAAITFTVTETEGADGGYAAAFPAGTAWSGTSSVNWFGPNQNLATAAIVGLDVERRITLRGGVASTHVVVDVTGYLI